MTRVAPHRGRRPGVRPRVQKAAGDQVVAPDDVAAPRGLDRHARAGLRAPVEARKTDRAQDVEKAGALLQRVVIGKPLRGELQDRFDEIGRQLRIRLQHQRDRAGHLRRGHARSAHAQIRREAGLDRSLDEEVRMGGRQRARGNGQRENPVSRRDEIGLRQVVAARRTARAERRQMIVAASDGPFGAGRADGEHPRRVARAENPAVLRLALRIHPEVAGRGDDDNPLIDETLRGARQRIGPVGLRDGGSSGEIDDADVVGAGVSGHPLERGNDRADGALAVLVEHLQRDERRARRHARLLAFGVVAVAENDARDVRPVTVVVVGKRLSVDEVDEFRHALIAVCELAAAAGGRRQIVVPARDPGVDDRDADAFAAVPERLRRDVGRR